MIFSQRIYFIILFHVLLILVTAGTGLWLVVSHTGYIIGGILLLCSLFQIGTLTRQLNTFNRKIRLFFDAVQDKDNMLYFPEANVGKEQAQLNRSLNRLNDLLARTKGESHKQEHFYQSLLEEVPSGVLAWDDSGRIIIANSAAFSLLKCNRLYTETQLAQLLNVTGIRKSLSISEKKMILDGETITILSIKDIGDELSDKENESWSKLTHVLTHEIMNSVTPITSLCDTLLSMSEDKDEEISHGLQTISTTGKGLLSFVESYRQFTRIPAPEPSLFYVKAFIERMIELARHQNPCDTICFHTEISPADLILYADENLIAQVVINLLKNAIQAIGSQPDGRIELRAYCNDMEEIWIEIKNNGPEIPSEIAEHIFIPFFTTKENGSGIGLSISRQIMRLSGGSLTLLREKETTFILKFK